MIQDQTLLIDTARSHIGKVNGLGAIQCSGGVNQKIEGYFDVCRLKGLTGTQGVIIPSENVEDLMLREDVVEAVAAGRFHIHPVASVEQGIEILTGVRAGQRGAEGTFEPDTCYSLVDQRLRRIAKTR